MRFGLSRLGLDVEIHQQAIHGRLVHHDLLVASVGLGIRRRQLQPVQGALARPGFAPVLLPPPVLALHVPLAGQQRQQGILPQLIVVVEILVAQGDAVHALPHQLADAVFHQVRSPVIAKTGGELAQDAGALFHRAQQQRPGFRGDLSAIEPGHHVTRKMRCKRERKIGYTLS